MIEWIFQLSKTPGYDSPTLRGNLTAHIIDGALFGVALSFISVQTVMPVFVNQMGGSAVAIASVPVLWMAGLNLLQVPLLGLTNRAGPIKTVVLRYGLLFRVCFLVMSLFALVAVKHVSPMVSVSLFLTILFATAVVGSMGMPVWFHLFAKTTPVRLRGRVIAVRQLFGSVLGMVGGSLVSAILSLISFPENFALLFFLAFLLMMYSYAYLKHLREPLEENPAIVTPTLAHVLRDGMALLRKDSNFRNFLVADGLLLLSMTASAFYAVYGLKRFGLPSSYAGTFTTITMAGMAASNVIFGYVADISGHRVNLLILALASMLASVVALVAPNLLLFSFVFFFMACTISLVGISRMSFIAELCPDRDRPLYVAITNTLTAPTIFGGIVAGFFVSRVGYAPVLGMYGLVSAFAFAWLLRKVRDPRRE